MFSSASAASGSATDVHLGVRIAGVLLVLNALVVGYVAFTLPAGDAPSGDPTDPRWQEVATKLDLAKAYEEMGDKDGARELLNEVLTEGDAAQQGQAKEMLAKLG